ncbi:phosphatidate cytidylyltransferase [Thermodesulfobacteriota bacterium]
MLRTRIIAAAILIVVLVPILVWGGTTGVAVLVALFGTVAMMELGKHMPGLKASPSREITLILGLAMVAAFALFSVPGVMATVVWAPLVILLIHLLLYHKIENTVESASQMVFLLAYVMVPLGHVILISRLDMGVAWVLFMFVVICFGDAGAYFAGKYKGRHRFSKTISPSKTVEGLLGGLAGSFIGMLAMKIIVPELPPLTTLIQLTILLAVLGPLGDLCASAIKRKLKIKDFGSIIPGHGGVMDRADSLLMAFPATFYFLVLVGGVVPQ